MARRSRYKRRRQSLKGSELTYLYVCDGYVCIDLLYGFARLCEAC